ncbi:MAG: DUF6055 domain-containing protein [Gemmatimonadales bacterium]|nr:DUF6055 domain-containing protein [Gemmatimonadales bacterium]
MPRRPGASRLAPVALLAAALVACDTPANAPLPPAAPASAPLALASNGNGNAWANGQVDEPSTLDLIEADAESGAIDRNNAARYREYALLSPDKLPAKYRSTAIGKDGTESMRQTALAWRSLSAQTRKEINDLRANGFGQLKDSLVTTHFILHYTTQTDWGVPAIDADASGVPDYVEEAGKAFERSWQREIVELGYPAPKQVALGEKFHVYFRDIKFYGYCVPENVVLEQTAPVPAGTATAWIVIENDFRGFLPNDVDVTGNEPLRLGALRVTIAHEFMHALQFNMNVFAPSGWLFESHATWAEDQVYDEVNDWRWYLRGFFARPDLPIFNRFIYGAAFYQHHLSETYGLDVPRRIWLATRQVPPDEAVRREAYGAQGWEPFTGFGPVQYTLGIEDFASNAPSIVPRATLRLRTTHAAYPVSVDVPASTNKVANLAPWGLGANAIEFLPAAGGTTLRLTFDGTDGAAWRAIAIGTRANGTTASWPITLDAGSAGNVTVAGLGTQYVKVALVALIADRPGAAVPFRYGATLQ